MVSVFGKRKAKLHALLVYYIDFSQETGTLPLMTEPVSATGAINAALRCDWKQAIRINTQILKNHKTDVEALSRLGFAYMKTGQILLAKTTYQKVIKLDQYNQIALKNIQKLTTLKKKDLESTNGQSLSPMMFLEDPGRTKMVDCINIAPTSVLSTLSSGQELFLKPKKHGVEVRASSNTYVGALPDDVSFKLIKLMEAGNTYQVNIKTVDKKMIKIFIRELTRGKRNASQPSFIANTSYLPFSKTTPLYGEMPDMTPTGEDDGEEKEAKEE